MSLEKKETQFSIRKLLAVTAVIAVLLAGGNWVLTSDAFDSSREFPFFFSPSISTIGASLLFGPIAIIGLSIAMLVIVIRKSPRPITSVLFLASILLLFLATEAAIVRVLIAMLGSSLAIFVESFVGGFSKHQLVLALLAFATTTCFYMFLVCVFVSAGV